MNQYFLWSGLGAIEDLDQEGVTTLNQALSALTAKVSGDWTLWWRSDMYVTLIAAKVESDQIVVPGAPVDGVNDQQHLPHGPRVLMFNRSPAPDGAYWVHGGTIHRAVRQVMANMGANRGALDAVIDRVVTALVDARLKAWMASRDFNAWMASRIGEVMFAQKPSGHGANGTFKQFVEGLISAEIGRVLKNGLEMSFHYPPFPTEEPHRRMRPEDS